MARNKPLATEGRDPEAGCQVGRTIPAGGVGDQGSLAGQAAGNVEDPRCVPQLLVEECGRATMSSGAHSPGREPGCAGV